MRLIDRLLFLQVAPRQVRWLSPPDYGLANGLARQVIDQMARDFVVGPPITLHIANPELMAGVWSMGRECISAGRESRVARERIAEAVSRLNACPYCVDIHAAMLHAFHAAAEHGTAAEWALATLTPEASILRNPPFPAREVPQMLGTAVCFHYLNRMVNLFLAPSPFLFHSGWIVRISGAILRPLVSAQRVSAGEFLTPETEELPSEFLWAAADPAVAGGIARFSRAAEDAGAQSVPAAVRKCITGALAEWRGEPPPLGREWLETAVTSIEEADKPLARLALVTARASHRVSRDLIEEFRQRHPEDRTLLNVAAWSSYAAVRRIASWLG